MSNVTDWIYKQKWAIMPEALSAIVDIANRNIENKIDHKVFHGNQDDMSNQIFGFDRLEGTRLTSVKDGIAIISVFGPIFTRADLFSQISGATSFETLTREFKQVLQDSDIDQIILNIDSPGGSVAGNGEFADLIFESRKSKSITAYISGYGASAAYYVASAASQIVMHESSSVGSIGTVMIYDDDSEKKSKQGLKSIEIVSSVSPKKRLTPASPEGKKEYQKFVDQHGMQFAEAVARNRGTAIENVLENFGQGSMVIGENAVSAGMADQVSSLDNLISSLTKTTQSSKGGIFMSTLLNKATVENLKAENPSLYDAVKAESTKTSESEQSSALEAKKAEGVAEGIKAENERLKGIESLNSAESSEMISKHKFDSTMTKEMISLKIVESQNARVKATAENIKTDAEVLAKESEKVDPTLASGDDKEKDAVNDMVAGAKASRRY